jgi:HTH-like domain
VPRWGAVLQQICTVTNSRATYGHRRVWAMVDRTFRTGYNRKRIRRVMQLHGLMLAPRIHRRHRRLHLGQVQQPASNQRWCSDVFLIPCWSGEVISVAFAIDCHDREIPTWDGLAAPTYRCRYPNAHGPDVLGSLRRSGAKGAARDRSRLPPRHAVKTRPEVFFRSPSRCRRVAAGTGATVGRGSAPP